MTAILLIMFSEHVCQLLFAVPCQQLLYLPLCVNSSAALNLSQYTSRLSLTTIKTRGRDIEQLKHYPL